MGGKGSKLPGNPAIRLLLIYEMFPDALSFQVEPGFGTGSFIVGLLIWGGSPEVRRPSQM
jgi:hypothetical protein